MNKSIDYSLITETPELKATQEQSARLYHRYHFARQFTKDKDILEAACGAGIGLGYLARVARKVIGIDIEEKNVSLAKEYYKKQLATGNRSNIEIHLMDAHSIDFHDNCFDLVLLFEAIYYLRDPQKFVSEAKRVLRKKGILLICTVNKDWEDFHPSPYTYKYFSVHELYGILKDEFSEVKLFGAFPTKGDGPKGKIISLIKRFAVKLDLIPGNLKARSYLKRIFMGKLTPLPYEVSEDMTSYMSPVQIPVNQVNKDFKIIYALAVK